MERFVVPYKDIIIIIIIIKIIIIIIIICSHNVTLICLVTYLVYLCNV